MRAMRALIIFISITLTLPYAYSFETTAENHIRVVAHRGARVFAPENTLAAMQAAIDIGVDIIEMDIRETADGELVVIHDDNVKRTTNGEGKVSRLTLQEVKKLDAGSWFSPAFKGERIPTLREALEFVRGRAIPNLDFKDGSIERLDQILIESGYGDGTYEVIVASSSWIKLSKVRKMKTPVKIRTNLWGGIYLLPYLNKYIAPEMISMEWFSFSTKSISSIKKSNKKVFMNLLWVPQHDLFVKRVVDADVDFIQSDRPDKVLEYLRKVGKHR